MLFNSIQFLIFFPVAVSLYFLSKQKYRWIVLLAASYYFYLGWGVKYTLILFATTVVDYSVGIWMSKTEDQKKRKQIILLSLFSNLGVLFFFKYFNFFNHAVSDFLKLISIPFSPLEINVLLPVGISFYTFQSLTYTIDIYRKKIGPEKHFGIFALYVSFFPQLVAGPIERARHLLPQFYAHHKFGYKLATDGVKLMIWGFFKKIVIADRLSLIVNMVYNNPEQYQGTPLIIATVFFAFQIYCDFSGYSDIAIGSAQVMGFNLMDNFKRPYFSRNLAEFWNRWHISLSSWFREYIFEPIIRKKFSMKRIYFGLMIVFFISGLWHGASYTFVIWGILHGIFLVSSLLTEKWRKYATEKLHLNKFPKIHDAIRVFITFSMVCFTYIFFRSRSLHDALYIISKLFSGLSLDVTSFGFGIGIFGLSFYFALIVFLLSIHYMQEHVKMRQFLSDKPVWIRWPLYLSIIMLILIFGNFNNTPFIYFQF